MNEEQILVARLRDLANQSYNQNIYTYSTFLTPAELMTLDSMRDELSFIDFEVNGGSELCERCMVRFGSEEQLGYTGEWPISIVQVEPLIEKFADELTHRDFLGAVMNLGIERNVLGDILVKNGKKAYIFCQDKISDFIVDNLTKIKHTNVKCRIISDDEDLKELKPTLVDVKLIVQNPRFDAIIAAAIKCSRSEALNYFKAGKVTLNGRMSERNSITLKEGDIFSVRGHGKYLYCGCGNETRKGRVYVNLKHYE
ncbi:MAG: YlmH/Sll1252 family protein [Wujia sp.]